jgi:hypothetical protein
VALWLQGFLYLDSQRRIPARIVSAKKIVINLSVLRCINNAFVTSNIRGQGSTSRSNGLTPGRA